MNECSKCGSTERYSNGRCAPCRRATWREWAKQNPDKAGKFWREHPEQKVQSIQRWQKAHPANRKAASARERAKLMGTGGDFTPQEWQALLDSYDNRCAYCKRKPSKLQMDHILPICQGGSSDITNIAPACEACNRKKGSKLIIPPGRQVTFKVVING